MPRMARLIVPGYMHHVVQRGNYKQIVFETTEDLQKYAYWISQYVFECGVEVIAYCLMSNHVHFVVIPKAKDSLARLFSIVHMRYSQYKNKEKKAKGHLWQGRFYSCVLDGGHLLRAVRYVERNPVRANLVRYPWEYAWSSAREHLGLGRDPIIKTTEAGNILKMISGGSDWRSYLGQEDEEMAKEMRRKTRKGSAVGSDEFIGMLEKKIGYSLADKKPPGRPRKK